MTVEAVELPCVLPEEVDLAELSLISDLSRSLECPVCGKFFLSLSKLNWHKRSHLPGPRPHQCDQCEKSFLYRKDLARHLVCHSDERPFECDQCGQAFKRYSHMKAHLDRHAKERIWQCSVCCKGFRYEGFLRQHMEMHIRRSQIVEDVPTDEADDFTQCRQCPKVFQDHEKYVKHVLAAHVPIEAQFGCGLCLKNFEFEQEAMACFLGHSQSSADTGR